MSANIAHQMNPEIKLNMYQIDIRQCVNNYSTIILNEFQLKYL